MNSEVQPLSNQPTGRVSSKKTALRRGLKKACKGALTLRRQRRGKTRSVELFIPLSPVCCAAAKACKQRDLNRQCGIALPHLT